MLAALVARVAAQEPQSVDDSAQQQFQLSVDVNLVVLNATVRNRDGAIASGLLQQDFEVFENGRRQTIRLFKQEDTPATVGLVIDHSGSMATKLPELILAARAFAKSSNADDEMFVLNFNEHVTFGLTGATKFTNSPDDLEPAILRAPTTGLTALYDAIFVGLNTVQQGSRERKVLIVISDGSDNASVHSLAEVLRIAEHSSTAIYSIGTFDQEDPDRNPAVLRRMARETGGEAYFPAQLTDVAAICQRIAEDIRNQYTIGFASTVTTKPGTYRSIRVSAQAAGRGKLVVRTRAGYIAGGSAQNAGAK